MFHNNTLFVFRAHERTSYIMVSVLNFSSSCNILFEMWYCRPSLLFPHFFFLGFSFQWIGFEHEQFGAQSIHYFHFLFLSLKRSQWMKNSYINERIKCSSSCCSNRMVLLCRQSLVIVVAVECSWFLVNAQYSMCYSIIHAS